MVQAYNFLASWQLFPEKCIFQHGTAPKSGNCKIEADPSKKSLIITTNWVTQDNSAFVSTYHITPDGEWYSANNTLPEQKIRSEFENSSCLAVSFEKNGSLLLDIRKEIMPNGYLKITQNGFDEQGISFSNLEVYHKQLSVLPYAASVGSVAIRPTEEGVIKHKALLAMEEQTDMQLNQIRQQIELLAKQAQELYNRKELSHKVYTAKLSFQPVIGQTYYLYEKQDGSFMLSLISPKEWGGSGPFKEFSTAVKLLADHTWMEVDE